MLRRAIPAQKGAPWEFIELVIAAAGVVVGDDVGEIEDKLDNVGPVAVATLPGGVSGMELSGDNREGVAPDEGEVAYGCD